MRTKCPACQCSLEVVGDIKKIIIECMQEFTITAHEEGKEHYSITGIIYPYKIADAVFKHITLEKALDHEPRSVRTMKHGYVSDQFHSRQICNACDEYMDRCGKPIKMAYDKPKPIEKLDMSKYYLKNVNRDSFVKINELVTAYNRMQNAYIWKPENGDVSRG